MCRFLFIKISGAIYVVDYDLLHPFFIDWRCQPPFPPFYFLKKNSVD
jgi:hypothetical protein